MPRNVWNPLVRGPLKEAGRNVYCSELRFSLGKKDMQIHTHVYSYFCLRSPCKENKNNDNKIKGNIVGEAGEVQEEKYKEGSEDLGRAKEEMNQPFLLCPLLPLLCNCSEFSGFLNSVTFIYITKLFFLLKYLFALSWTVWNVNHRLSNWHIMFPCFAESRCPGIKDLWERVEPLQTPCPPPPAPRLLQPDPRRGSLKLPLHPPRPSASEMYSEVQPFPLSLTHWIY